MKGDSAIKRHSIERKTSPDIHWLGQLDQGHWLVVRSKRNFASDKLFVVSVVGQNLKNQENVYNIPLFSNLRHQENVWPDNFVLVKVMWFQRWLEARAKNKVSIGCLDARIEVES